MLFGGSRHQRHTERGIISGGGGDCCFRTVAGEIQGTQQSRLCGRINQGRFWQIYGQDKVTARIRAFYTRAKFRCHPRSRARCSGGRGKYDFKVWTAGRGLAVGDSGALLLLRLLSVL